MAESLPLHITLFWGIVGWVRRDDPLHTRTVRCRYRWPETGYERANRQELTTNTGSSILGLGSPTDLGGPAGWWRWRRLDWLQADDGGRSMAGRRAGVAVECRHCGSRHVWRHGSFRLADGSRQQRYLCRTCGRSFCHSTGTIAAYIKKRNLLAEAVASMTRGIPLRRLARSLKISLSTAFRWRHLVLAAVASLPKPKLSGCIVLAELYVPYSEKGSRTARGRRGGQTWWQVGPDGPKQVPLAEKPGRRAVFRAHVHGLGSCVLVMHSGTGHAMIVAGSGSLRADALQNCLARFVDGTARGEEADGATTVFAFGSPHYEQACRKLGLGYRSLWDERRRRGVLEVTELERPCEKLRSGFRAWLSQFAGVATRYLHHYVAWYDALVRHGNLSFILLKQVGKPCRTVGGLAA